MTPGRAVAVSPPLQVVTGKGGVGKSTVAAAIALDAARAGHEVLALEIGEPAGLAAALSVRPEVHGVPVLAAPRLHVAFYEGEAALAEYLGRFMPWRKFVQSVLAHPLYRAFVSAGPGVRELMAIGKVRDELLGISAGRPLYDLIVLDAGASGHALQLLGMPAATARTFSGGRAHRESTRVASTLADPRQTAVHVVALPEAMPLAEAGEIVARLAALELPLGRIIVNRCREPAPPGTDGAAAALADAARGDAAARALARVVAPALGWLRVQEEGIAALEAQVGRVAARLPHLVAWPLGRAELEALGGSLASEEAAR